MSTPPRPSWVNRSHTMWVAIPSARETTSRARPAPRHGPPLPSTGLADRRHGRACRGARRPRRGPTAAAGAAPATSARARATRVGARSATRAGAPAPAPSSTAATRDRASGRSAAAVRARTAGRSGAIAPTAIAAGTSGVRTNGSATTAWLGVNGMRRLSDGRRGSGDEHARERLLAAPEHGHSARAASRSPMADSSSTLTPSSETPPWAIARRPSREARHEAGVHAAPGATPVSARHRGVRKLLERVAERLGVEGATDRPDRRAPRMRRSPRPRHPARARSS